jgi:glycosyltransferase involved in cell wall biosynthesis
MKVAWITPYLPEPAKSGGAIRQQRLAAALARRNEVHLFARGEIWENARLRSAELSMFESAWLGRDYWPRATETTESRRVRRGSPASLARAVSELHRKRQLDLVVVAHSWASLRMPRLGLPWLLDEHNIESRYFADACRVRGGAGDREISEIARWERLAWKHATAVTCVCDADADAIAEHRPAPASDLVSLAAPVVVANGADLERGAEFSAELRQGGVLFVGAMHHAPNVDAARRLVERILPRARRELPDLALSIVGGPVPRLLEAKRKSANERAVNLAGVVPDVGPFLAAAQVYANPVTHGAGSSLKIVEALAAGVPLVSTELGARGFGLVPGIHYLSAEGDEEQALAIVRVVRDPELAASLSRAGREHAERYGWDALGAKFVELAERAAQK